MQATGLAASSSVFKNQFSFVRCKRQPLRWLFFLPLLLGSAKAQGPAKEPPATVVTNVTLIDATGSPAQPDRTVVVARAESAEYKRH